MVLCLLMNVNLGWRSLSLKCVKINYAFLNTYTFQWHALHDLYTIYKWTVDMLEKDPTDAYLPLNYQNRNHVCHSVIKIAIMFATQNPLSTKHDEFGVLTGTSVRGRWDLSYEMRQKIDTLSARFCTRENETRHMVKCCTRRCCTCCAYTLQVENSPCVYIYIYICMYICMYI
jgi:hypothetical protein